MVVVSNLVLIPITPNMISYIGPGSQAIYLGALEKQQFFIRAPGGIINRDRILLNNAKWMCCRVMIVAGLAVGEALDA